MRTNLVSDEIISTDRKRKSKEAGLLEAKLLKAADFC